MQLFAILSLFAAAVCLTGALPNDGISMKEGLTDAEKKTLLDEHNRLRSVQAQGKVPGQPPAADMTHMEWSDSAAQHAQTWANNCGGPMHGNHEPFGEGQDYAGNGDRSRLIKDAFTGWFDGEYPAYVYGKPPGSSGHYTQIVTAYSHEVGCGANSCDESTFGRLVCNFFIGGNLAGVPPFKKGPACSKCPGGYGYCKNFLCASHRVCAGDSSCKCTVDQAKCAVNGEFDSSKCECKCKVGFTGLNCDEVCEDPPEKMCPTRKADGECKPSPTNHYFVDMVMNCKAACGQCKAACVNKPQKGTDCDQLKDWGNCENSKPYMQLFCPKSCGFC